MALKLNEAYPGRFNNPSPEYPQGSFKNRTTPTAEDGSYFEQQWANDHLAFLSSLLDGAGVEANGAVDEVNASQYYDALLQIIQSLNADTINAPIATVAAAATTDLTTGAPDTSQIAISGTGVSINGFTVAANRLFIVKMTGASNTLINSASLVTGRGANIPVVAGDSFLMRSTAANTVEILCGNFVADSAVGTRGQAWQDMTASRVKNVTYTNTSGRAICVSIHAVDVGAGTGLLIVDGVTVGAVGIGGSVPPVDVQLSAIVPNGSEYVAQFGAAQSVSAWAELR